MFYGAFLVAKGATVCAPGIVVRLNMILEMRVTDEAVFTFTTFY